MKNIIDAITALDPNAQVSVGNDDIDRIQWHDDNPNNLTNSQILAKRDELVIEYDALQYQRDRQPDYPNLAEQFDLLWHAIDADTLDKTSDFYTTLKAVKDAHPKG
jgi:hypothetical protein